jgi:hypothetical protein
VIGSQPLDAFVKVIDKALAAGPSSSPGQN